MTPRGRRAALILLAALLSLAATRASADPAPVYYQRYPAERTWVGDELALLRAGQVRVQHYPPVDVSHFAWERDSFTDYTWWMQMQELRFLLPALASGEDEDLRLALAWFMRWYANHMVPRPATAAWGEPMTAGYRAMVLVRLWRAQTQRADADTAVVACLRTALRAHQRDLARPGRFYELSNHAFIASLGLLETTRAIPDSSVESLALRRLDTMMQRAVSPAGVEMEHSPAYHFVVMGWLEQMAGYFETLEGAPRAFAPRMRDTLSRMHRAGYFLQDHDGRIAPIGDTDSLRVEDYSPEFRRDAAGERTLYDPASGFAVYRGDPAQGDCRYVVLRIPGGHVEMRSHCHDDALSVFVSHAGETILGDAGRYSYASSPERDFVRSANAHNTVVVAGAPPPASGRTLRLAERVAQVRTGDGAGWTASTRAGEVEWSRTVEIPPGGSVVRVVDRFPSATPGVRAGELVMLWHLGTDVIEVEPRDAPAGQRAWTLATRRGRRLVLEVRGGGSNPGAIEATVSRGMSGPFAGGYSPSQDVLRIVTTLAVTLRAASGPVVVTELRAESRACAGGPPVLQRVPREP
jgi:hypothetical protein